MKRIMIMGAGIYQTPLIKTAKRLGHYVVVVSPPGNYPGLAIADEIIDLDTKDRVGVLKHAKRIEIDAVVTAGTDVAVPTIGYLVDELGLPGTGYEAAERSMNKAHMKQIFLDHGVRTAEFYVIKSLNAAKTILNKLNLPIMVKAIDSSGSRGITQVSSINELDAAYYQAKSVSTSEDVILEQCLVGCEIGAQAIVSGNEVVEIFLHSDEVTAPPISVPIGHALPLALDRNLEERTKALVRSAIQALGIRDTLSNVDIMIVDNEPYILEVGARIGATCLAENVSIFGGFDAYEFILQLALGQEPRLPTTYAEQANASFLLRVHQTGKVKRIVVPEHIRTSPNLIDLTIDVKVGDTVREFKVGPDRVGHVIVKSVSHQCATEMAKRFASEIRIEVET